MITLRTIPGSAASAITQYFLVEIDETLCKPYSIACGAQPVASVTFQSGAVTLLNGFAIVPVIATVVLNTPSGCACGKCDTNVFVERVNVPFAATDDNTITVVPGTGVVTEATMQKCGKARGVKVTTTLRVQIA